LFEVRQLKVGLIIFVVGLLTFPPLGLSAKKADAYLIGREDVLDITVWQSPDLTKSVTVQSDGTIDYPILGNLSVAGVTTNDLEKILTEKLSQGYVKSPQVSVTVKEYNSKKILVFGEVGKPGLYKLKGPVPVLELLFMVGGANGDAKRMTVIRPSKNPSGGPISPEFSQLNPGQAPVNGSAQTLQVDLISLLSKGDLAQNVNILPGDTIYVASGTGQRYHVLGQVAQPGPYEWVEDVTVLEAIKLAGGVNERGAPNRIKVRKIGPNGQKYEVKVNIVDIMNGKKKDDVIVKPGDTIIVPESWI